MNLIENVLISINSNKKEDRDKAKALLSSLGLEKEMEKKPT